MQLKERTGNKDIFDVMKKQKHHKLKKLKAANKESKRAADLFSYLNKSLAHGNKGESEHDPVTGITDNLLSSLPLEAPLEIFS